MFRLLRFLFFALFFILGTLAITGTKIGGKTVPEHFQEIIGKKPIRESMKDVKALVGEAVREMGKELSSEEVTEEERKKLDTLIEKELKK